MLLSPKYRAFLRFRGAAVEVLEGTTYAGKTTVGILKYMLMVAESPKRDHVIAGLDLGTLEKNIITKDYGIKHVFGSLVDYRPQGGAGITMPHIVYHTPGGDKIIYVLGYDNKARWKKALGGQYGCVYVDEANVADMDFLREVSIRNDYWMMTLNPDDPALHVYSEYINHCRPLPQYAADAPKELLNQLDQPPKEGWVHWYFTFDHNAALTPEKRAQLLEGVPKGSKIWKNKILGLRGRATGLVFDLQPRNIISAAWLHKQIEDGEIKIRQYTCGVDTSYSQRSDDTFAFVFQGLTECGKIIQLACRVYNNKLLSKPLSPSDIPPLLVDFLEGCRKDWGLARTVYIDNADAGTILECQKYRRQHGGLYNFAAAWKKTQLLDRINLQAGWMAHGDYLILDTCGPMIEELNAYSWKEEKNEPEDRNDHTINASQYGWLPYKHQIGGK